MDEPLFSPRRLYHACMMYLFWVGIWYPELPHKGLWYHLRWHRRPLARYKKLGY